MISPDQAIQETQSWIVNVVAGCNFCPFAAREVKLDSIHYRVTDFVKPGPILQALLDECRLLDTDPAVETGFVIITEGYQDFEDYLDLVELAEKLLKKEKYEGVYQVASFHPEYRFEGAPPDDPANFTNRSMYPMLHLLREESIEKALKTFPNPDSIPEKNITLARKKGFAAMEALRSSCKISYR